MSAQKTPDAEYLSISIASEENAARITKRLSSAERKTYAESKDSEVFQENSRSTFSENTI